MYWRTDLVGEDLLLKLFATGLIEHKYHDSYHLSSKKETGLIDLFPVIGLEELLMHSTLSDNPENRQTFLELLFQQDIGRGHCTQRFLVLQELMKETKENISCWSKCRLGKALWPCLVTDLQKVKAEKDLRNASPSQYHPQMRRPRARRMRSLVGRGSEFTKEQRLELHSRDTVGPFNWREGYRLKDSCQLRWLWRTFWVLLESWEVNKGPRGGEGFTGQSRNHCMKHRH